MEKLHELRDELMKAKLSGLHRFELQNRVNIVKY